MPIYQYRCRDCDEISEMMLPMQQEDLIINCRSCGSSNIERLISVPGLIKVGATAHGATCCGRDERCETPACSTGDACRRLQ